MRLRTCQTLRVHTSPISAPSDEPWDGSSLRRLAREHDLFPINVAPPPSLRGVISLNDWMSGFFEMRAGMLERRVIAAANVTAGSAQPKMHPRAAHLEAFFITQGAWHDITDRIRMVTGLHATSFVSLLR